MFTRRQIKQVSQLVLGSALFFLSHACLVYAQPQFPDPAVHHHQTHDGDLILKGNDVLILENTNYKVNGSIVLQDSAKLVIRQSIIELLGEAGEGQAIHVRGSSILQADTTIFGGDALTGSIDPGETERLKAGDILADDNAQLVLNNCFSLLQTFLGNSTVTIRNSYLMKEPLGAVHVEGNADVLIEDSYVGALFLEIPNDLPVVIDSLRPGFLEYWSAREQISDSLTYNLVLRNTEVMNNDKGYKGGMELGWNIGVDALRANITISNSKLNKFVIEFPPGEPAYLSDLVTRQPVDFHLNNIHLLNTEIQTQWGVFMNGGPAEIVNSEGLFIFMTGGDSDIIVYNSEVGEIDPRNYTGTLIFEQSTWLGGYEIFENSHIQIRGSVRMLPTVPIFDQTSTLTRSYDVVLREDTDGSPLANVNLTLTKDGSTVWSGTTDAEGEANLEITFDDDNADEVWRLSTDANHININKAISILISNPVILNLELEKDSIHYRPVVHVAPGDPVFPTGTRENPYPAIQEAIDNSGGSRVYVRPGTYTGYIEPGRMRGGITLKDSVTVLGAGADSTILAGNVEAEGASGAHISGFTIEDEIHAPSASLTITNNVIANYAGTAIWGSHANLSLINNVLASNGEDAIFLHDSSTALIKNNVIVNNGGFGINGVESASASIDYNDVWGNEENYFEFFSAGDHDISEDPRFVDAARGDFHLQSGSPCIDTGDPDPQFNDRDGSRNNMGAFGGAYAPAVSTAIDVKPEVLTGAYALYQNHPNPFNPLTSIEYELPKASHVRITVYDLLGRELAVLVDGEKGRGRHEIVWDPGGTASGVYLYRIEAGDYSHARAMVLLR